MKTTARRLGWLGMLLITLALAGCLGTTAAPAPTAPPPTAAAPTAAPARTSAPPAATSAPAATAASKPTSAPAPTTAPPPTAAPAPTAAQPADKPYINVEDPGVLNIISTIFSRCRGGKPGIALKAKSHSTAKEVVLVREAVTKTDLKTFTLPPKGEDETENIANAPATGTVEFYRLINGKPEELVGRFKYGEHNCTSGSGVTAMLQTHCSGDNYWLATVATTSQDRATVEVVPPPGSTVPAKTFDLEGNGGSNFLQSTAPSPTGTVSYRIGGVEIASLSYEMLGCGA